MSAGMTSEEHELLAQCYKARGDRAPDLSPEAEAEILARLKAPVVDWRNEPLAFCERCCTQARGDHNCQQEGRTS